MLLVVVRVVPALGQLDQRKPVRAVTVHLVGGHVDERGVGTVPPAGLKEVQGAAGVRIEILEGNGGGAVGEGCAAVWTTSAGETSRTRASTAARSRISSS